MDRPDRLRGAVVVGVILLGLGFGNSALHTWVEDQDRLGAAFCGIFSIVLFVGAWRIWHSND
jgi:hypothetical protein